MYCRLPYVFRGALPLKTLVLYIYRLTGTMQYNQKLYAIYSSYMLIRTYFFDPQSLSLPSTTPPPGRSILTLATPGSPRILLIQRLSSLSRHHALVDWKFLLAGGEDSPPSA
jgi:hypothetical protein